MVKIVCTPAKAANSNQVPALKTSQNNTVALATVHPSAGAGVSAVAVDFTPSVDMTPTALCMALGLVGAPNSQRIRYAIWDFDTQTQLPTTMLGYTVWEWSAAWLSTTITGASNQVVMAWDDRANCPPKLTAGKTYAIGCYVHSATSCDGSNCAKACIDTTGGGGGKLYEYYSSAWHKISDTQVAYYVMCGVPL